MAQKLHDPYEFLKSLVTKKGKSDLYGVYLTGVSIVAPVGEISDYGISADQIERNVNSLMSREENDWNRLLVETRRETEEIVFPIAFHIGSDPVTVYFLSEGHDMSALVMLPKLSMEEFKTDLLLFQELLRRVSSFAGKLPTVVKYFVGVASIDWFDLVEDGSAIDSTIDLSY